MFCLIKVLIYAVFLWFSVLPVKGQNDGNRTLGNFFDFSSLFGLDYGDREPEVQENYDFVIVGAGPAGIVVANRLSENPDVTVLLLEIGKAEIPMLQQIPGIFFAQAATDYNFGYTTERQKQACLGLVDQKCAWHQGRGLGGSTIINNMLYVRGNRRDFDYWNSTGNPGWSYDEVLPYFLKSENANVKDFDDNGYHGKNGYLSVEDAVYRSPLAEALVESCEKIGLPYVDYNGKEQYGSSFAQFTMEKGRRRSAGAAFLNPIKQRKNLHILTNAWVTKVLFKEGSKEAEGVLFSRNKRMTKVNANREVILSAGAFGSAKLLMLSGVGPKAHLQEHDIDVIHDLPVGETLYDHPAVLGPVFTASKLKDKNKNSNTMLTAENILKYMLGSGPLASSFSESFVYFRTPFAPYPDPKWPDIELIQLFTNPGDDGTESGRKYFRIHKKTYKKYFAPLYNKRAFMFLTLLMHSTNKGSIRLKSKNPYDHPVFNYQYFEDERDLEAIVHGMKGAVAITSQKPFQDLGVKPYTTKPPGCEHLEFNSDEYWRCHAKTLTYVGYHFVGTCKMGPSTDPTAVVDHRLRVHGMRRLRVVDVGIIPVSPTGHTSAYAYMIGEKAADMIKEDNHR
ncbi:glucose dehydrogenase [FAD, quinone]-like [Uranotaenia lowii]|uniref:glucose dehydrogenase [FAD, quinone]-like n=1 Tax=Uranotaenia lowii TaxID=190385 RepID=UPI00247A1240|nr:glucose dehydrogenase [FAD, quinone]-like [Uranotaenia lowii]